MSGASDKPKTGFRPPRQFAAALGRLAEDLFTLEVITIVQDDIAANKMPPPEDALRDIARMYEKKLSAMRPGPAPTPVAAGKSGAMPAFQAMMDRARVTMEQMGPAGDQPPAGMDAMAHGRAEAGDTAVLQRILDNSQDLMKLSEKMESMAAAGADTSTGASETPLTLEEMLRLHMIWQMGVEQVAMKTTIYVSGDVVTRVRPELLGEDGRALVEIHNSAIRTSVEFWKTLVDVLGSLLGGLGQFLFSSKNRDSS